MMASRPPSQPQRITALVVDDSAVMRQQLCYALQRSVGIEPVEAADGADGWKKLESGSFQIVLTDVNMPVMDGLKLISLLRSGGRHQDVPVIVITTEGAEVDRERAMRLGASAYLVKPVKARQVVEAVKRLLHLG